MVSWRDRGYVPDSDEEDEAAISESDEQRHNDRRTDSPKALLPRSTKERGISIRLDHDKIGHSRPVELVESANERSLGVEVEHGTLSETNVPAEAKTGSDGLDKGSVNLPLPGTTASLLEAELHKGLRVVQEVIGLQNIEDDSDSPLSSPPSSTPGSPNKTDINSMLPSIAVDGHNRFPALPTWTLELAAARRSLRARAPIQLHPYALEAAQYQRDWKSRGLRPIRDGQPAGENEGQATSGDDSQKAELFEESGRPGAPPGDRSSSPMQLDDEDESQSPIRGMRTTRPQLPEFNLGAELPDLSDLLENDTANLAEQLQRSKKAKARKPRLTSPPIPDGYQVFDLPSDGEEPPVRHKIPRRPLQIPPSPPRSRGGLSSPGAVAPADGFQEADRSPLFLPSPFLSSDKPNRKRPQFDSLETSEVEVVIVNDASSDSTGSSTESEDRPPESVRVFRRRIKGVLPASWLKLDRRQQKGKNATLEQARSPEKVGIERGIAQRLPSSSIARVTHHSTRPLFDDSQLYTSEDDDSSQPVEIVAGNVWSIPPESVPDDIMEDNSIDPMLPPRSRSQYGPRLQGTKKKKQKQLPETWSNPGINTHRRSSKTQLNKVSNGVKGRPTTASKTKGGRKKRKKIQKKSQLSLLDAPGFAEDIVPRYLKIAARHSERNARQSGVQDTTKKFFQLATAQDTRDVNTALRGWRTLRGERYAVVTPRDGTLMRAAPAQRQRSPSVSVTGNSNDHIELVSLKQLTDQTLKRVYKHQSDKQSIAARQSFEDSTSRAVLRDYFQPPSVAQTKWSTIRDQGRSTYNSMSVHLPVTAKVPLPRLVTKAAGGQTGQSLSANQMVSTHTSSKAMKRQPRKRHPLALKQRRAMMGQLVEEVPPLSSAEDRVSGGIEKIDFDYDILDHLTDMLPEQEIVDIRAKIILPGYLNGRVLHSITTSMASLNRIFESNERQMSILMPHTQRTVPLGRWKASAKSRDLVADLLSNIQSLISSPSAPVRPYPSTDAGTINPNAAETGTPEHHKSSLSRWVESLDGFIEWLNAFLWFESSEDLEDFVTTMVNNFVRLGHVFESQLTYGAEIENLSSQILPLFTRLVVLCYQVKRLVDLANLDSSLSLEIREVYEHLVDRTLSISLSTSSIKPLFDHLISLNRLDSPLTKDVSQEVESILVVHQLSEGQFWDKLLEKLLSRKIDRVDSRPAMRLVYSILINFLICSIQTSWQEDESENISIITPNTAGLTALQNALSDFLKQFSSIESQVTKSKTRTKRTSQLRQLAKLGSFAFRWVFLLFHASGRSSSDQLIKKLLKHYGDRNMQNFFVATGPGVDALNPSFLAAQASVSQIVLETNEPDFHIFLKLIALTLGYVNDHAALRKLISRKQSLIFSLLPNNVFHLNEEQSLTYQDLSAMANRYNLFSTIYNYAPRGYRPPLANIQGLVAFDESHQAVCDQVLKCWASISRSLVIQGGSDEEYLALGHWIRKMLLQIIEKWRLIPLGHGEASDEEQRIHHINRQSASFHICKIIQTWVGTIDICVSEQQARLFTQQFPLSEITGYMIQGNQVLPEAVSIEVFNIITAYLKKSPDASKSHLNRDLHPILQRLISNLYDPSLRPKDETLRTMMETWYLLASSMVNGKCAFWDSYISPASMTSFDQMGCSNTSRDCNVLFLSKALTRPDFLTAIDHFYVFEQWLNGILRARDEIRFETLLTSRLFQAVPATLDFSSLHEKLKESGVDIHHFTKDSLIRSRLSITRHIIRQIYQLSVSGNITGSGMLSKVEALRLLRVIQKAMRRTWENLPVQDKPEYTALINSVVLEMSAHKVPGFETDPFFSSSELLDQTEKGSAEWRLFTRLFVAGQDITASRISSSAIEGFRSAVESSCAYHNTECLLSTGVELFGAASHNQLDEGDGITSMNTSGQLFFMQAVFPEFICRAFEWSTPTLAQALPVIDLTTRLMKNIRERVDFHNMEAMQGVARWISMTLHAVFRALYDRPCQSEGAFSYDHLLLSRLVTLVTYAATAFSTLTEAYPNSEQIELLSQHSQNYIYWVYEYACSGYGIAYHPLDAELQETYPDSAARAIMGFGLDMPSTEDDPFADEELEAVRKTVRDDLVLSSRANWVRVRVDEQFGPVWAYRRAQSDGALTLHCGFPRQEAKELVADAVEELRQLMVMLGLSQV